jgi:hypothetical protein
LGLRQLKSRTRLTAQSFSRTCMRNRGAVIAVFRCKELARVGDDVSNRK